jgi:hypothetical protein
MKMKNELKFNNVLFSDKGPNLQRFESECKKYAIQRFTYYNHSYCDEYFVGYRKGDGMRLTDLDGKSSFKHVIKQLQNFEGKA